MWSRSSLAARRAGAELNDAAALLAAEVAAREPAPAALAVTDVVDRLAAAVGLPAVAAGVGAAVRDRIVLRARRSVRSRRTRSSWRGRPGSRP